MDKTFMFVIIYIVGVIVAVFLNGVLSASKTGKDVGLEGNVGTSFTVWTSLFWPITTMYLFAVIVYFIGKKVGKK